MTGQKRLLGVPIAILVVANLVAQAIRAYHDPSNTDYVSTFNTAALMLHNGDYSIYCSTCLQHYAVNLYHAGAVDFRFQYDNPPLAAWLLQPLALLGAQPGLAIFLALSALSIAAAAWLLLRPIASNMQLLVGVLSLASLPGAITLALAQWDALLLLALASGVIAANSGRTLLAGLLLSILILKPQLVWLVPFAALFTNSWRLLVGFTLGGLVWLLTAIPIIGWDNTWQWLHQISPNVVARTGISVPHASVALFQSTSLVLVLALGLGVTAIAVGAIKRQQLIELGAGDMICLAVLASMMAAPHLLPYDLLMLAVPALLWARRSPHSALIAIAVVNLAFVIDANLPLRWQMVELPALGWFAFGFARDALSNSSGAKKPSESPPSAPHRELQT